MDLSLRRNPLEMCFASLILKHQQRQQLHGVLSVIDMINPTMNLFVWHVVLGQTKSFETRWEKHPANYENNCCVIAMYKRQRQSSTLVIESKREADWFSKEVLREQKQGRWVMANNGLFTLQSNREVTNRMPSKQTMMMAFNKQLINILQIKRECLQRVGMFSKYSRCRGPERHWSLQSPICLPLSAALN